MRAIYILLLLQCSVLLVTSEDEPATKDIDEDYDDLERKHRKKKKKHQNNPCYGGYGRTFGSHDQTYVSAPVTNYFFDCGGAAPVAPIAPVYPYPGGGGGQYGHGHGGHGHGGHGHGGHGHGGHGGQVYGQPNFSYNPGYNPGYNQYYHQYQSQYNRPFQNVVSAAASGLGSAFANYLNRPRKFNKQVNQYLRPLYNLF